MKKIIVLLLFLLAVPMVFAEIPTEFNPNEVRSNQLVLPVIEYGCFNEFADSNRSFSFFLYDRRHPPNMTKLREENPDSEVIIIRRFDEMCEYTTNVSGCYDCITLQQYGLWNSGNETNTNDTDNTNIKKWLFIIIGALIILLILLAIFFKLRQKQFKKRTHGREKSRKEK